jgi:hypothetical protein
MKISKLLPVLCALAVGVNGLTARAEDNPEQAAARVALAKKLFEIGAQSSAPANAADTNAAMAPVNSKDAKAKAKADKAAAATKVKQDADQSAAGLKAKQEAEKKLAEQQAAQAKAATAQAEAKTKADKAAAAAAAKQEADQREEAQHAALAAAMAANSQASASPTATNAPAAKAKVAKAKKEKKQKPAPTAQSTAAPAQPANTAGNNYAGKDLGMKPIAAPALPIAASKEERLQALLVKYKADQISPEEYHQQRAAILAEP